MPIPEAYSRGAWRGLGERTQALHFDFEGKMTPTRHPCTVINCACKRHPPSSNVPCRTKLCCSANKLALSARPIGQAECPAAKRAQLVQSLSARQLRILIVLLMKSEHKIRALAMQTCIRCTHQTWGMPSGTLEGLFGCCLLPCPLHTNTT